MNPIINPWWIYLSEKSGDIGFMLITLGIFGVMIYIVGNFIFIAEAGKAFFKKAFCIASITSIVIGSLFPSQKTVLTMMTVQQLTPTNIEIVGNTIEDTVDYIVEKIEDIIEEEE